MRVLMRVLMRVHGLVSNGVVIYSADLNGMSIAWIYLLFAGLYLFPCMHRHMSIKAIFIWESFSAHLTCIWFLPSVYSLVNLQRLSCDERLTACHARKWPITRVHSGMNLEVIFPREPLPTCLALMLLFSVRLNMRFQLRLRYKGLIAEMTFMIFRQINRLIWNISWL